MAGSGNVGWPPSRCSGPNHQTVPNEIVGWIWTVARAGEAPNKNCGRHRRAGDLRARRSHARGLSLCSGDTHAPVPVPPSVLKRMITSRGGLPDHPARTPVQMTNGDMRLLRVLTNGLLVVRKTDFDTWYRSERTKGKWPSQSSRLKPSSGRPRKRSPEIKNAVGRLVRNQAWSAKDGIPALRRILVQSGRMGVPNVYTLGLTVLELFVETGDLAFHRLRKPRSAQPQSNRSKSPPERDGLCVRK